MLFAVRTKENLTAAKTSVGAIVRNPQTFKKNIYIPIYALFFNNLNRDDSDHTRTLWHCEEYLQCTYYNMYIHYNNINDIM